MSIKPKSTMSPFPSCFHPPSSTTTTTTSTTATTTTSTPNLTTSLYQTSLGIISVSWSRSLFSRSLHLILPNSSSFHLSLKPFLFWSHSGSRKLLQHSLILFWDFSRATFRSNSSPDPASSFYLAVFSTTSNSTLLFLGDLLPSYRSRLASCLASSSPNPAATSAKLVVRREHVCGAQFYATKTTLGGKSRDILIEVNRPDNDDPRLVIRFDNTRVIQVKHLKWKFRGSERFDVDGHRVHLSWDVYNWLFDDCGSSSRDENYALFTFRFEAENADDDRVVMWGHDDSCGLSYERKKMRKKLVVKTSSSSSSSLSSASSSGSSSVMEWESVEENELKAPTGFSLLVYAWKN